jgi:hypothetical protein
MPMQIKQNYESMFACLPDVDNISLEIRGWL